MTMRRNIRYMYYNLFQSNKSFIENITKETLKQVRKHNLNIIKIFNGLNTSFTRNSKTISFQNVNVLCFKTQQKTLNVLFILILDELTFKLTK